MNNNLAYQHSDRVELINGEPVMMSPSPAWNHVSISGSIYNLFSNYLRGKACKAIPDGFDLRLSDKNHFIPDGMVVCDRDKIKTDGVHGAPDLVVEVLSPSTAKNDRFRKKNVYQLCGVREYWIADPANRMVEQYFLADGVLQLNAIYAVYRDWEIRQMTEEERAAMVTRFKCSLFDDFEIALEDIFTGLLPDAE